MLLSFLSLLVLLKYAISSIPDDWELLVSGSNALYSSSDDGKINSEGYPGIYLPLIGNGYISHSKGVRSDTYFISGVFNNETTSPSHRARIPATFAIQIDNTEAAGTLLDLREGTYYRRGVFTDGSGGWYELRWYAHMGRKHLYVMELDVYLPPNTDQITLNFTNNIGAPSEDINFKYSQATIDGISISVECGDTTIPETSESLVTSVCVAYTPVPNSLVVSRPKGSVGEVVSTKTFITSAYTSLDTAGDTSAVRDGCIKEITGGIQSQKFLDYFSEAPKTKSQLTFLREEHAKAWATLWESGIEVMGSETSARQDVSVAINASLFAVLSSVRADWPYGLAPGGLTNYYNGHSFWDTETWMYPPMLMMHPSIGHSLTQYRFDRLEGAYAKALTYDPPFAGAMFPWESAFSGVETCPLFADTGLREQHISADISLAVWQYWSVTHDEAWLKTIGMPVLVGVADFLVSKAVYDDNKVAHINDVIPPDEYVDHVNDSVYTNYGAKCALQFVVQAADLLDITLTKRDSYETLSEALVMIVDEELGIHPEYLGYNGSLVKQADVVLLHYPWNMPMSAEMQRADLEYYSTRTDENGPAMTWGMHSIGHKDLNQLDEAAQFFNKSFQLNMQEPFMVWTETPKGNAGMVGVESLIYLVHYLSIISYEVKILCH